MSRARWAAWPLAAVITTVVLAPSPAAAHGVGGRSDLPVPVWQAVWGAAIAVAFSFAALGVLWTRARLRDAAVGRPLPSVVAVVVRALGLIARVVVLVVFVLTLTAGLFGSEFPAANLAPISVFIIFWVGAQLLSALLGDVWRAVSPWRTLAAAGSWVAARVRRTEAAPDDPPAGATHWPAVAGIGAFVWLELAYHTPASPRVLGLAIAGYTVVVLAAAARYGRGWLQTGEGFGALGLLAHLAPFFRGADGTLRMRVPLAGVRTVEVRPGTKELILLVLGATGFDGLTRTRFWADVVQARTGWELTFVNTLGLVWAIGVVALVYLAATRVMGRVTGEAPDDLADAFAPTLIPIVLAYSVAHYFSLLLLDGQGFLALLSDPYGEGWDLLGTADRTVDYTLISTSTIAWVQTGAIVLGHVAGVLAAHDLAIERFTPKVAIRSQYPLLIAMIAFTVGGLSLLLGA